MPFKTLPEKGPTHIDIIINPNFFSLYRLQRFDLHSFKTLYRIENAAGGE
jgi:hypothetical protein